MDAKLLDRLIQLTDEAMAMLSNRQPLSAAIHKAIRIARLRSDWENLWWLEIELCSFDEGEIEELKKRLIAETGPHFTRTELQAVLKRTVEGYMAERTITALVDSKELKKGQSGIARGSVLVLERSVETLERMTDQLTVPDGLHPVDLYFESEKIRTAKLSLSPQRAQSIAILDRIATRVHTFLSTVERQLFLGQVNSDIFERNRQYVDRRLLRVAPDVAEQFAAAYKRLESDDGAEALSHALTSCRRALKSLADRLYPASGLPVVGPDGKTRTLTDDKFVSRLWQYIHETMTSSAAGRTILAQLDDLGHRLERLNDLASKGVHAAISRADADQCVIQTYLLIGDILRLKDEPA